MVDLTPDCQNCAALCCVALAFDKGDMFAFDKPAGVACQHLKGHQCGIHSGLVSAGLRGCVQYQCEGAGQRVVQDVFAGQSWQDNPALLPPMLEAFADMRQVHNLLVLLTAAEALTLPKGVRADLASRVAFLSQKNWTPDSLNVFVRSDFTSATYSFLKTLKEFLGK